jgi:hypothetical protein
LNLIISSAIYGAVTALALTDTVRTGAFAALELIVMTPLQEDGAIVGL